MAYRILATLDRGKPTEQAGWARAVEVDSILEFETEEEATAAAMALHMARASSRITYAVESV